MSGALESILQHPGVWRGGQTAAAVPAVPTGWAPLDEVLPGGGWPEGALTEILAEREGIGEIRLLLPALARLSAANRWLALVSPPHVPYAPALVSGGVELARLLVINPDDTHDAMWAAEQALRSGACGAVLVWPVAADDRALRRLQLAAEAGRAAGFLFRPMRVAAQPSPAALRLRLEMSRRGLVVDVFKRRGGGPLKFSLDLDHALARPASASLESRSSVARFARG